MDENVVPIVEELQRRLPSTNSLYQGQGEEEEPSTTQNELAENGTSWDAIFGKIVIIA